MKRGPDSLTNHLKESEVSEGAPPTGGGVAGAGKCRCHADGRATVILAQPPVSYHSTFTTHPPFLSFQPHKFRHRVTTRLRLWGRIDFMMRIWHLYLLGFRTSILDLLTGSYFRNWMNSREKGSLADEAGPILNTLRLSWRCLTSGIRP